MAEVVCVYCGHDDRPELVSSFLVPDNTVYPGVQMICASVDACMLRIHQRYHREIASPECRHCEWSPLPVGQPSHDAPRASDTDLPSCPAEDDGWFCTAVENHTGPHVAYLPDGSVGARWDDDPPEYDPEADAADQAEEWAAGQRELAGIEAEEARDAEAEARHEGLYQPSPPDPDSRWA